MGPTAPGPDGHYLGDGDDGEDVSLAERQVLLGRTVEVVLGDTFCTGWPNGLGGGGRKEGGERNVRGGSEHLPATADTEQRGSAVLTATLPASLATLPASLTSSQGLRGSKSHGRDASLGTMRPGEGAKGQLRTAARPREAQHPRAGTQGRVGNAVCSGAYWPAQLSSAKEAPKPIRRRHSQQESPGRRRRGKRKSWA